VNKNKTPEFDVGQVVEFEGRPWMVTDVGRTLLHNHQYVNLTRWSDFGRKYEKVYSEDFNKITIKAFAIYKADTGWEWKWNK
jgi:hypothetical protein